MLQYAYNTYNEGCRLQSRSTIYRQRLSIPVSIHLATSGSRAIYSSTLGIIGSRLQCRFIINPQHNIFIYHIIKQSTCKRLYQPTYIINVLKYTYILSYNNIYCNTQYNEITHLNRNLRYHSYTHIFMGNSFRTTQIPIRDQPSAYILNSQSLTQSQIGQNINCHKSMEACCD